MMKNKFFNGTLSYFFTPRAHGNVLAWVKPASAAQRQSGKRVNENILRWEDDGGNGLAADDQPGQKRIAAGERENE